MSTPFPQRVHLLTSAADGQQVRSTAINPYFTSPRAAYEELSSPGARDMLNEYISAGKLPFRRPFAIYPSVSQQDHSTRVFNVDLDPADADGHGLPHKMLMRVVAPLDPFIRTEMEVAFNTFVGDHGPIPVVRVFYFDSTGSNSHGLEWMLTSAPSGFPIDDLIYNDGRRAVPWPTGRMQTLTPDERLYIRRQIETLLEHLRQFQFSLVGGLFCNWLTREYFIGPLPRWSFSRNSMVHQNAELLEISSRTDVQMDGEYRMRMMHGNLHVRSILVDLETLKVTCFLDWSCAVIAPPEMLPEALVLEEI